MKTKYTAWLFLAMFFTILSGCDKQETAEVKTTEGAYQIKLSDSKQVIKNFGASDAWACQFVGKNWPMEKRNKIADLLFSTEFDEKGNPLGIGLSLWRFNIGAGSAEQGADSDIKDEWRRAETFLNENGTFNWEKQEGQRWFLDAAQKHGVDQFVAFVNSPPVYYTNNGKAYSAPDNKANLKEENIGDFAEFMVDVLAHFKSQGIDFDYISPVNEPQWNWDDAGQEGSSYRNTDIYKVVKALDQSITDKGLDTKIEIPEAGKINYLYESADKPERGKQIQDFFNTSSELYLGDLTHVAKKVAAHSYFTTYPEDQMIEIRKSLVETIQATDPELEYWMSEYCVLEDNNVIKGGGRVLTMDPAIYIAKVMHYDLTVSNANAWHWWLSISPYDYKDGLVYIENSQDDGAVYDSKMLWAMGNYSRFVRPGMQRVAVDTTASTANDDILISAYTDQDKVVVVIINSSYDDQTIELDIDKEIPKGYNMYMTNAENNLGFMGDVAANSAVTLAARSVITLVSQD
ncbi:MAG: xylanase [Thalassobius sp.]|nr:xylanase [Thalassovita sp.]